MTPPTVARRPYTARRQKPQYDAGSVFQEFLNVQQAIPSARVRTVLADTSIQATDDLLAVDTTGGPVTVTFLPPDQLLFLRTTVKWVAGSDPVTIVGDFGTSSSIVLSTVGESVTMQSNGTTWIVLATFEDLGEHNVRYYGAHGDGAHDDGPAFSDADADGAVIVPPGTYAIASDLTLSSALQMQPGAVLKPAGGATITVNGVFSAPLSQMFDTSAGGSIRFARGVAAVVWAEWFGAGAIADDAVAMNAAIASIFSVGGTIGYVYLSTTSPINLTNDAGGTNYGLTIRNYGRATANGPSSSPSIHAAHTGHVFDCAGTANLIFEDVSIYGDSTTKPKTGWFFARNTAGSDGGGHRLRDCRTEGYFSVAPIYAYGSELNEYTEDWIWNQNDDTPALIITGQNVRSQASTFITIASGAQSNITHNITGGSWWCGKHVSALSTAVGADAIYLESASAVKMTKAWIASGDGVSTGGRSLITVDGTNQTTDFLTARDITGENLATLPAYGIRVVNGTRTHAHWSVQQNRLLSTTRAFFADSGQTLDSLDISQLNEASALGIEVQNLQNSYIRGQNTIIKVNGTSSHNVYVCSSANLTILDTRTADVYLDTLRGAVYKRSFQGSTPTCGFATLVAGTVTVANTAITSNSFFHLQRMVSGGTIGDLTFTKSAGVSFTITSSSATDTSQVFWLLTEVF